MGDYKVERDTLLDVIGRVTGLVAGEQTYSPALGLVGFRFGAGGIAAFATNGVSWLQSSAGDPGPMAEECGLYLPDLIKASLGQAKHGELIDISIIGSSGVMVIKRQAGSSRIKREEDRRLEDVLPAAAGPVRVEGDMDAEVLRGHADFLLVSADHSKSPSRPALVAVQFLWDESGSIDAVTMDGYSASLVKQLGTMSGPAGNFLLPLSGMKALRKLSEGGNIHVRVHEHCAVFSTEDAQLTVRLVDEKGFPNINVLTKEAVTWSALLVDGVADALHMGQALSRTVIGERDRVASVWSLRPIPVGGADGYGWLSSQDVQEYIVESGFRVKKVICGEVPSNVQMSLWRLRSLGGLIDAGVILTEYGNRMFKFSPPEGDAWSFFVAPMIGVSTTFVTDRSPDWAVPDAVGGMPAD